MKNFFSILILTCLFVSCKNYEKYEGKWALNIYTSENDESETPMYFQIKNDSIKFNYWSFDHSHEYSVEIKENQLLFNNWGVKANIIEDTLSLQNSFYIKDNNDSIREWWWSNPITKIDLPKINSDFFKFDKINHSAPNSYVLFGKRLDNNKFSLQLNDKYAELNDLPAFLNDSHHHIYRDQVRPIPSSILLIDKTTPMKHLEKLFLEHKKVNRLKVGLINNINLNYDDSVGLHYNYEVLNKKLPNLFENDRYRPENLKLSLPPLPPPPYYPFFGDLKPMPQFIILKNDIIYHNNKAIISSELKSLAKQWIRNENTIFSLYDLQSTYGKFLEMTTLINSVYQNERNKLSKNKFDKPLNLLNQEEMKIIKLEIPMYHVWSYSIPHYNHILENNNTFFGMKAPRLDNKSSTK